MDEQETPAHQPAGASAPAPRRGLAARLDTPRKVVVGAVAFLTAVLALVAGVRGLLPRDTDPSASIDKVSVSPQTLAGFRQRVSMEQQDASATLGRRGRRVVLVASAGGVVLAQGTAPVAPPPAPPVGDGGAAGGGSPAGGAVGGGESDAAPDASGGGTTGPGEGGSGAPGTGAGTGPGAETGTGTGTEPPPGGETTPTGAGTTATPTTATTTTTTTVPGPGASAASRMRAPDEVTDVLSQERPVALPEGMSPERLRDDGARTLQLMPPDVGVGPGNCPAACRELLVEALTGDDGEPVSPAVAAVRLTRLLGETRTTATPDGPSPAGMLVDVAVRLVDLEDQPVLVNWQLLDAGGQQRLFDRWIDAGITYRLVPESDDTHADLPFWVPLPEVRGPFLVRVYAWVDEQRSTHSDSDRFG